MEKRNVVSVVVECKGKQYRAIDNLRDFLDGEQSRVTSEGRIGRKVLDLARTLEVKEQS